MEDGEQPWKLAKGEKLRVEEGKIKLRHESERTSRRKSSSKKRDWSSQDSWSGSRALVEKGEGWAGRCILLCKKTKGKHHFSWTWEIDLHYWDIKIKDGFEISWKKEKNFGNHLQCHVIELYSKFLAQEDFPRQWMPNIIGAFICSGL